MSGPVKSNNEISFQSMEKLKLNDEYDDSDSDDEKKKFLAYVSKGLKKEKGKFKSTLPLICFRCGGIGHFATRYKKKKKEDESSDDDDDDVKRKKFFNDKKKKVSMLKKFERYKKKNLVSKESDDSSTEDSSSDDESSDEESVKSERRARKKKSLSRQYVFMTKSLASQKNVEQKDVFEGIVSDDESNSEEEIDYEKELTVTIDYLNKETKKRKETAKILKQTETQVVELKEKLLNTENLLNKKDECILNKVKEVEQLKSLDTVCETGVEYAEQLKMSENQVVQLKTTVEEI